MHKRGYIVNLHRRWPVIFMSYADQPDVTLVCSLKRAWDRRFEIRSRRQRTTVFLVFVWSCAGRETNQSLSKEFYQMSICKILEIP